MRLQAFKQCVTASPAGRAEVHKAESKGCSLNLKGYSERLILDLDRLKKNENEKAGDLLVFLEKGDGQLYGLAVELKSGDIGHAKKVVAQVQAALGKMEAIVAACPAELAPRALVLHGPKKVPSTTINVITGAKVYYNKQRVPIRVKSCGTHASDFLK